MPVPDTSVLHATGGRTVETQPGDVRRARAARLYTGNLTFQKLQQTQSADPPPRSKVGGKPGGLIFFSSPGSKGTEESRHETPKLTWSLVAAHEALARI